MDDGVLVTVKGKKVIMEFSYDTEEEAVKMLDFLMNAMGAVADSVEAMEQYEERNKERLKRLDKPVGYG
tara:strand:- start:5521 stop:5727 length:207 start_codon:yes stop_codon:yes gene_type:complete